MAKTSKLHSSGHFMRILDWSSLHAYLIWIYEGVPRVRSGTFEHHDHIKAWLIRKGSVRLESGAERAGAEENQWIIPAHGTVRQEFSANARILSVRFYASWPSGEDLVNTQAHTILDSEAFPRMESAAKAMERIVRRHFPSAGTHLLHERVNFRTFFELQRLLFLWIEEMADALRSMERLVLPAVQADARVLKVAQQIHRIPLHQPFSSQAMARDSGLSPSQMDRLFVHQFHVTPRRYFEKRRLNHARDCLLHTTISVKALAYQLGFAHASYFTAWFQHRVGIGPRAFRKQSLPFHV